MTKQLYSQGYIDAYIELGHSREEAMNNVIHNEILSHLKRMLEENNLISKSKIKSKNGKSDATPHRKRGHLRREREQRFKELESYSQKFEDALKVAIESAEDFGQFLRVTAEKYWVIFKTVDDERMFRQIDEEIVDDEETVDDEEIVDDEETVDDEDEEIVNMEDANLEATKLLISTAMSCQPVSKKEKAELETCNLYRGCAKLIGDEGSGIKIEREAAKAVLKDPYGETTKTKVFCDEKKRSVFLGDACLDPMAYHRTQNPIWRENEHKFNIKEDIERKIEGIAVPLKNIRLTMSSTFPIKSWQQAAEHAEPVVAPNKKQGPRYPALMDLIYCLQSIGVNRKPARQRVEEINNRFDEPRPLDVIKNYDDTETGFHDVWKELWAQCLSQKRKGG